MCFKQMQITLCREHGGHQAHEDVEADRVWTFMGYKKCHEANVHNRDIGQCPMGVMSICSAIEYKPMPCLECQARLRSQQSQDQAPTTAPAPAPAQDQAQEQTIPAQAQVQATSDHQAQAQAQEQRSEQKKEQQQKQEQEQVEDDSDQAHALLVQQRDRLLRQFRDLTRSHGLGTTGQASGPVQQQQQQQQLPERQRRRDWVVRLFNRFRR
ncbi:hypothetical protein F5Y17DRAFT_459573 [Xylariaceae sp. FL0594]|nr:hypothetical protein F5Y17DRAFT_459573 [Xylariaceae sp. FL0594]